MIRKHPIHQTFMKETSNRKIGEEYLKVSCCFFSIKTTPGQMVKKENTQHENHCSVS